MNNLRIAIITAGLLLLAISGFSQATPDTETKTLVVLFDGLRPDYITAEAMPNLYAFSKDGCYGLQHHSVFPTVTRVNASSYSSGSYPQTHGLMGNTVYFPEVNPTSGLNTGNYKDLFKISEATHGHLLTTITLGEVLAKHNQRMMVFSSGSQGQALMQNHTVSGGAIVNPQLILPESFKNDVIREVGPIPTGKVDGVVHRWITDAWMKFGLAPDGPLVSSIWYADPDGVAHDAGMGAPTSMESIKVVDAEFGRILAEIKSRNLSDKINIIVSADHGFISHNGKIELEDFLIAKGLKKAKDSEDVVLADKAIFVANHDPAIIQKIVSALQAEPWVGPVFTRGKAGDMKGSVAGTLSFESIHWNHPARAADILIDNNWSSEKNEFGYAGTSTFVGVAGHGGLSPYEVHIALLASGPAFKKNFTSELPTSNVDIVPTILAINKLPIPDEMDGRVMNELLKNAQANEKARVVETAVTTAIPGGQYKVTLQRTVIGNFSYVDKATTVRTIK
ncbi:alkaline phosphatase family protein [Chryseolinea sp. T2]|uniref:alkaline phosphatase family protein n=1 Tax=Chryseolinea sp. T2 TaxID=3129255 RepID=UPI003077A9C5